MDYCNRGDDEKDGNDDEPSRQPMKVMAAFAMQAAVRWVGKRLSPSRQGGI